LTLKEKLGEGAFCKVRAAIGTYDLGDGETEVVPYAVKVYKKNSLKGSVPKAGSKDLEMWS
jgi:hypothetical protein